MQVASAYYPAQPDREVAMRHVEMLVLSALFLSCADGDAPESTPAPSMARVTVLFGGQGSGDILIEIAGGATTTCRIEPGDGSNGGACRTEAPRGSHVTLTARPDEGSIFLGWSGNNDESSACRFGVGPCELLSGATNNVYAIFEPTCTAKGWCHELPVPSGLTHYQDIWGSSPSDVWIFGGDVVHWDGTSYTVVPSPIEIVGGAWGSGPGDVWAAGRGGLLAHWDGAAWLAVPSGARTQLHDLFGTGPGDVWAVGDSGTAVHWDGSSWSPTRTGTANTLNAVWGTEPRYVLAVGDKDTVLIWNGLGWQPQGVNTGVDLHEVWGSGPGDIWISGWGGWSGRTFHFDGGQWQSRNEPYGYSSLSGSGPSDLWGLDLAGFSEWLMHWNGRSWSNVELAFWWQPNRVWSSGPADIWVVGHGIVRYRPHPSL